MPTNYPNSFLPYPAFGSGMKSGYIVQPYHISFLYDELSGLENVIGLNPNNGWPSLTARISGLESTSGVITSVVFPLGIKNGILSGNLASAFDSGFLTKDDWNSFNNKQNVITAAAPLGMNLSTFVLSGLFASATKSGFLKQIDWSTFNSGARSNAASSTDTALVRWNGTTGKIIQDSSILSDGTSLTVPSGVTAFTLSGVSFMSNSGILTGILKYGEASWTNGHITYVPSGVNINTYIAAAGTGDTLILSSSTYTITTAININKSIAIRGQGNATVVNSTTAGISLFSINSSNVIISDLSIIHSGGNKGIQAATQNLNGLYIARIAISGIGSGDNYGIDAGDSNIKIENAAISEVSTNGNAYGLYVSNNSSTTQNSVVSVSNSTLAADGLVTANPFYLYNNNVNKTITVNAYRIDVSTGTAAGTNDIAAQVTSTTTNTAVLNAYDCTLNGTDTDILVNRPNVANLYSCMLKNNTISTTNGGLINYSGTQVISSLYANSIISPGNLNILSTSGTINTSGSLIPTINNVDFLGSAARNFSGIYVTVLSGSKVYESGNRPITFLNNGGTGLALTGVKSENTQTLKGLIAGQSIQLTQSSTDITVSLTGVASTSTSGLLTPTDWNTFNSGVRQANAPLFIANNVISGSFASATQSGFLSATDWTTFNAKQAAGNYILGATNLGTGSGLYLDTIGTNLRFKSLIAGSNITFAITTGDITIASTGGGSSYGFAGANASGILSSGDWNTFNNKQAAGNYAKLDTSNQPFSGALNVSGTAPEYRITTDPDNGYARWMRTTNLNEVKHLARVAIANTSSGPGAGLIEHYLMDDNAASTAVVDNKGVQNGVYTRNTSLATVAGKIGTALSGLTTDYTTIASNTATNFGTGDFSFFCWIKTTSNGVYISSRDVDAGLFAIGGAVTAGKLGFYDGVWRASTGSSVNDGNWHHVGITRTGGTSFKFWVDGVSESYTGIAISYSNTWVLAASYAHTQIMQGVMDDVRIYNLAVSATDVATIYAAGTGTQTESIVATMSEETYLDVKDGLAGNDTSTITFGANGSNMSINSSGLNFQIAGATKATFSQAGMSGYAFFTPISSISSNYTATVTDSTLLCSGTFQVILPSGITGRQYNIKNIYTGVITLTGTSSQTIDGSLTQLINTQWSTLSVVSNSKNWFII